MGSKKKSSKKQNGGAGKSAERDHNKDSTETGTVGENNLLADEAHNVSVDANGNGLDSDPAALSCPEKSNSTGESESNEEKSQMVEATSQEMSNQVPTIEPPIVEKTQSSTLEEPESFINSVSKEDVNTELKEDPKKESKEDLEKESKEDNTQSLEITSLKQQIESLITERDSHKTNYENLLARLSSMRTVFSRMKESEGELEKVKLALAQVRQEKLDMAQSIESLETELTNLNQENTRLTNDLHQRKEQNLSEAEVEKSKNYALESSNKKLALQLSELKASNEEYVILLNEEKILKENLTREISELEQRLKTMEADRESAVTEKTTLESSIENLKSEKSELLKQFEHEKEALNSQKSTLEERLLEKERSQQKLETNIESLEKQLQRMPLLESEVKEKQLQIGKLRHEAIILNEHLTKSLKLLKSSSSSETVDRELVSNLFISFLSLPRGDSKKFEVLQLISNFLSWDDDKQHHAGLINKATKPASRSESFVSLWTEFLEKESTQV